MTTKKFGEIIAERRKELRMSQQQLADKVHLSKSTISRYESGFIDKLPSNHAIALAKELKIPLDELLIGINPSINSNGETEFWMPKENTIIESQESSPQVERLMDYVTRLAFHGSEKDIEKANDMLKVMFPEYTKDE